MMHDPDYDDETWDETDDLDNDFDDTLEPVEPRHSIASNTDPDGVTNLTGQTLNSSITQQTIGDRVDGRALKPRTIQLYRNHIRAMHKHFVRSSVNTLHQDVRPIDLVDNLIARTPNLRPHTAMSYRSALLYWLDTLGDSTDVHHARLALQVGMPKTGYRGHKPGAVGTLFSRRSTRKRTFEKRSFDRLLSELSYRMPEAGEEKPNKRSSRATELMLWLKAGLATGLRPGEWEFARWDDEGKTVLRVRTIKRKASNALPTIKGIPKEKALDRLVPVEEQDRLWVDQHMARIRRFLASGRTFKAYYDLNRLYLRSVCLDVFGDDRPPFTLYMMRGQFAANKKRAVGLEHAAELMGCEPDIASTCYGNKIHAHSGPSHKEGQTQTENQKSAQESKAGSNAKGDVRFNFGSGTS